MSQAFDLIAADYDHDFTFTETGRYLRSHIHRYLELNLLNSGQLNILELNCGTGEDAVFFGERGHRVIATDSSISMISVAETKTSSCQLKEVTFQQMSFMDVSKSGWHDKFDLVFSNFGGLNCLGPEDFKNLMVLVRKILKPGGRFVGVVMPKLCLWEIIYFTIKGKPKMAFRRRHDEHVEVILAGQRMKTWYYSPKSVMNFAAGYCKKGILPVGIFLPPTFMEPFFARHSRILKILDLLEKLLNRYSWPARFADHFLIDLMKLPNEKESLGNK